MSDYNEQVMELAKEFDYFREHQEEIVREYNGRYVILMGHKVVADCSTADEASRTIRARGWLGKAIYQHAIAGPESYTMRLRSWTPVVMSA